MAHRDRAYFGAFSTSLFVMPLQVLSLDEKTAALAAMDTDLKVLLVAHKVTDDIAAVLSHAEFRSVTLFSSMTDDTATFRTWAKVNVRLDNGLAAFVSVGKFETQKVDDELRAPRHDASSVVCLSAYDVLQPSPNQEIEATALLGESS